jgi:LAS superfamily LD-carboxypeptidase LdcB
MAFTWRLMRRETIEKLLLGEAEEMMITAGEAGDDSVFIHPDTLGAFNLLRNDATLEGFDLKMYSGFRSFEKQLDIWNRKTRGELAVLDVNSHPIDITHLNSKELVYNILRFSALPGASRHHWGTEIDFYDYNAFKQFAKIDLISEEYTGSGPFARANRWLDSRIAEHNAYGFFKPYISDKGGVSPEPWHLSWAPLADTLENKSDHTLLLQKLQKASMNLKEEVIQELPYIWEQYVINVEGSQ